ncbi:hypothetical protein Q5565_27445, partial [Escherichia coli]|nr:hypothetical protein [Escherichia coli]
RFNGVFQRFSNRALQLLGNVGHNLTCLSFYCPNIDIRAVKTKTGEVVANVAEQLQSAVAETLKYSVKP